MTMEGHRLFAALKESGGMERRLKGFLEQKDKRMLRVEEHNQTTTLQKVTAVRKDTETCADMLASFIMLRLKGASLVYFFLAAIYTGHGKACILGGCLLVLAIRIYWYNRGRILECGEQKRQREIRESAMVSMAHESYKEIKIDSRAETLIEKYDVISKEYAEIHKK